MFLDEVAFEDQGFLFGLGYDELEVCDPFDHSPDLWHEIGPAGKVRTEPVT